MCKRHSQFKIGSYIIFSLNTGLRLSELCSLSSDNIIDGFVYVLNKSNFKCKNDKERKVPLNDSAYSCLETILNHKLTPKYISKSFKRAVRSCKLNEDYTFHTLRKTFATNLVRAGISIFELKYVMGHSNIKTTEIYFENDLNEVKRLIQGI